jgi:beta-lactamase class A
MERRMLLALGPAALAITASGPAEEFVSYYQRALQGDFFRRPETLTELRRILSMADAIARAVPPGHAAYAKGGSIDWEGFHALCFPGQMVLCGVPATFCFSLNWTGPDAAAPEVVGEYVTAVSAVLRAVARQVA